MDERGRIVIPQAVRDALGISAGSLIRLEVAEPRNGRATLIHEGNARDKLLAAFSEVDQSLADRLVAERQSQR